MTKQRIATAVAAVGLLIGTLWLGAPAALADSGRVWNDYGYTDFDDSNNDVDVCDKRSDDVGVSGRISVRQGDGSWYHHKWHRDGNGNNDDCAGGFEVINRESADMLLTICAQNGAGTTRYACRSLVIAG